MSPKQWFALLGFYISYLFLGSSVFYQIEHSKELENRANQLKERIEINDLLVKFASPDDILIQNKILNTVSDYCGRPVTNYTLDEYQVDFDWTFLHSFWFSFIVCSTVGYGNNSPHDEAGQLFLIFYALIGLPLNGFVLAYLGEFFSQTVKQIYNRHKGYEDAEIEDATAMKFGMVAKIMMFIVPGIAIFIFLPACLFTYFEEWPYVRSVYYSFVTLTTIGFGDYVPTFQDGQARKFGTFFTVYQIFIIFWNIVGLGYFIMIIGFIAKGMQSKRISQLEHSLSVNIRSTQHRIWTEVTKDVSYLRQILNEVNMMKFKPVYRDSMSEMSFNALPRSSSCPELTMYREEFHQTLKKRSMSENYGSSTSNLYRVRSDGSLSLIDKEKTFASSDTVFGAKDLLSNVLTALGSIHPFNEDIQSCLELNMSDKEDYSPKSSFEWTWNGNNAQQIQEFMRQKTKKRSIFTLFPSKFESKNRSETLELPSVVLHRSFKSKINPFKTIENDAKTNSEISLNNNSKRRDSKISLSESNVENVSKRRSSKNSLPRSSVENESKRRESLISFSQSNMELLETTTIADLIRAIEEVEAKSNASPKSPLLGENFEDPRLKTGTLPKRNRVEVSTNSPRRSSLRPVSSYTTVFMSKNMKNNQNNVDLEPKTICKRSWIYPTNPLYTSIQKPISRRLRSISESVSTVQTLPQNSLTQSSAMLQRTLSLCPTPSPRNTSSPPVHRSIPTIPMITVQPPDVTTRNLLWHPEYEDGSLLELKKKVTRRLSDSK